MADVFVTAERVTGVRARAAGAIERECRCPRCIVRTCASLPA
jgi:hypothetical protein